MTPRQFFKLFALGAALRIFWISVPPLWYDENFTLITARLPFEQMLAVTMGDVHPPVWYMIEWMIVHLLPDAPAWVIRVPALLFSLASLPMFYLVLGLLDLKPVVQTVSMTLFAVLPMQIWYAQEGRMYAMLEFLVLVTLAGALARKYLLLFLGSLALLYTQNYGLFYLAAMALVIFVREKPDKWNWSMASMCSAGVLWLPWVGVIFGQMNEIEGRYWILDKSFGGVLIILYKIFFAASVPGEFFFASYAVTFAALIAGMIAVIKYPHPARSTVLIMAFVPILIAWVASLVWQPVLLFRPLIGISPFLYIVVAWVLHGEIKAGERLFALVIVTPILAAALFGYYRNITAMKGSSADGAGPTMLSALEYVERNWQPGDVIYATDDGPWINLTPYTDKPVYKMPSSSCPVWGALSSRSRDAMGAVEAELDDIPHTRAWIFAPLRSPLHPSCYIEKVEALTESDLVFVIDDSDWLYSGVWLLEK